MNDLFRVYKDSTSLLEFPMNLERTEMPSFMYVLNVYLLKKAISKAVCDRWHHKNQTGDRLSLRLYVQWLSF